MAKQNKPNKTTTKGKDLPESVQWLLDFANIDCKPGNLSLLRICGNSPVKRPPSDPATLGIVFLDTRSLVEEVIRLDEKQFFEELANGKNIDGIEIMRSTCSLFRLVNKLTLRRTDKTTSGFELRTLNGKRPPKNLKYDLEKMYLAYVKLRAKIIPRKEHCLKNSILHYRDVNGNDWIRKAEEVTASYQGNVNDIPPLEEIKDFLSKAGISEGRKKLKYRDVEDIWYRVGISLLCKDNDSTRSQTRFQVRFKSRFQDTQRFVSKYYKREQIQLPDKSIDGENSLFSGFKYSHDNTLIQVVCAYILDFWHNHRELHQHVRQCQCCGKFWIEAKAGKKFCCKKCEDRFNQASRQSVRESLRKQRKLTKENEELAHDEIIKLLCDKGGYNPKKAAEILSNEKSTNAKSLANFKRTYGKKSGLI
jgi:hypothetical protein